MGRTRLILNFCVIVTALHSPLFAHLHPTLGRFMQRDPLEYVDAMASSEYQRSVPTLRLDAEGTSCQCDVDWGTLPRWLQVEANPNNTENPAHLMCGDGGGTDGARWSGPSLNGTCSGRLNGDPCVGPCKIVQHWRCKNVGGVWRWHHNSSNDDDEWFKRCCIEV
jgi:hypothetical protein